MDKALFKTLLKKNDDSLLSELNKESYLNPSFTELSFIHD